MESKLSIKKLYKELSQKYDAIYQVDEIFINNIEDNYNKYGTRYRTGEYIFITTIAIVLVGYMPFILVFFYNWANTLETQLSTTLDIRNFLNFHREAYHAIGLVLFGILFYTLIYPRRFEEKISTTISIALSKLFRKKIKIKINQESSVNPNMKSPLYILYVFILFYFSFWCFITLGYSSDLVPKAALRIGTISLLMITALPFSFLPSILLIILVITVLFYYESKRGKTTEPESIIAHMLFLIKQVNEIDKKPYVSLQDRREMSSQINHISSLIRRIYFKNKWQNPIDDWANERMGKVASSFQSLGAKVLLPKENKISSILLDIFPYLNSFLKDNYVDAPQEIHENLVGNDNKKKRPYGMILDFILLVFYLILPLMIIGTITANFDFKIVPIMQTLLSILYAAWIIFGALYFLEKLSPELRSRFMEIVRSIIPK